MPEPPSADKLGAHTDPRDRSRAGLFLSGAL